MAEESKVLAEEVETTKRDLLHKIDRIGDDVREKFDWRHQVEKRPVEMVGGATLAGFLVGRVLFGSSGRRWSEFTDKFQDEIDFAKHTAFSAATKKLSSFASEAFPGLAPEIRELTERVSHKMERRSTGPDQPRADRM